MITTLKCSSSMFHMITLSQCISGYNIKTIQFILAKSNFKHIPKEKTTMMHISYTCTNFNSSIYYPPTLSICRNNSHCSLASLETLTTCTTQHTNLKSPNLSLFTPTNIFIINQSIYCYIYIQHLLICI